MHLIEKGVGPVWAGRRLVLVANYVLRSVVFCSTVDYLIMYEVVVYISHTVCVEVLIIWTHQLYFLL